jgi:integrase
MASTRERNGKFTGLYRDQSGNQKSAGTFKTQAAALKAAKAHEAVEKTGTDAKQALRKPVAVPRVEKRGKLTVAGYAPQWLSGHRLEATSRESYGCMLKHIIKGLGNVVLAELDSAKVRTFIRGLEDSDLSGSTVGHVMTVLREMCKTAVNDNLMPKDPTQGVKIADRRNREMRILAPAEYKVLLSVMPKQYILILQLLVSTGLRWGEAMGLKHTDITARGNGYVISVRRVIVEVGGKPVVRDYGKTVNSQREVTIDKELGEKLIASGKSHDDGFVVRASRGGFLSRANFRRIWIKACDAAGIKDLRVHDLRHTHASWLVNMSNDPGILIKVRDRLGHSDIKVTSRYLHAVPGESDTCLEALSRALAA